MPTTTTPPEVTTDVSFKLDDSRSISAKYYYSWKEPGSPRIKGLASATGIIFNSGPTTIQSDRVEDDETVAPSQV